MKTSSRFCVCALIVLAIGCSIPTTKPPADPRFARGAVVNTDDPGCETLALVSTGGAFPKDPKTLAIRWTGYTNFELVYNGQIILLDAHFDRGSMFPPLGFKAADVSARTLFCSGMDISIICRMLLRWEREPERWLSARQ